MVYYFYFLLVGSRRNECNSLWGQLRGRRQMSITTQKVFLPGIFTCSHITFAMVYYFYFLLVGSRRNECNSLWGGIRGRGQKSTTYSENISVIKFYLSTLTLHLLWSIIFIFCVLAPEGMNAIVFWGEKGERLGVYYLLSPLCCTFFQVSLMIR